MTSSNRVSIADRFSFFGLKQFRITHRIGVLVGLVVASTFVISVAVFIGYQQVDGARQNQQQFTGLLELTQNVEIAALQMRRHEKDFILRKDEKYVGKYDVAAKQAKETLSRIEGFAVAGKHLRA